MKNQIEITKEIADSMLEIGGNPTKEEFYDEFNFRLKIALGILQEQTIICPECQNLQNANENDLLTQKP
jgi:uncharacterized protein YcnI